VGRARSGAVESRFDVTISIEEARRNDQETLERRAARLWRGPPALGYVEAVNSLVQAATTGQRRMTNCVTREN